jgi:hypothetical protein
MKGTQYNIEHVQFLITTNLLTTVISSYIHAHQTLCKKIRKPSMDGFTLRLFKDIALLGSITNTESLICLIQ